MRLHDWVVLWEPSTVNLSPSTKARQDGIVEGHILRFGDLPLARIENADVQAWVAELSARGLAPATVKKVYDVFTKCVQAAVDDQRLPRNPARPVRLPKDGDHEEMRFLSVAEVEALRDVIDPAYRAWLLFMAFGGLRFGEAAALRWGRVNLLRGRVEVAEGVVEVGGILVLRCSQTPADEWCRCLQSCAPSSPGSLTPTRIPTTSCSLRLTEGRWCQQLPRPVVGSGDRRRPARQRAHPRPAPHRDLAVDRRGPEPQGSERARRPLERCVHAPAVRAPLPGVRRPDGRRTRHVDRRPRAAAAEPGGRR